MKHVVFTLGLICIPALLLFSQDPGKLPDDFDPEPRGINGLRIMFYNVENLFDTKNDTLKKDEKFLPDGARNWSESRFWDKLNKLSSVIISVGGWEPPAVVGLSEVENRNAVNALFFGTGLKKYDYDIIHFESPDIRGIDVAFAYRPKKLTILYQHPIPVDLEEESSRPTRDILYVKGKTLSNDTLHFFVNHWPSRWGGEKATRPKRKKAAAALKPVIDSLQNRPSPKNIIIMGDFNDEPSDQSIKKILKAKSSEDSAFLANLMSPYLKTEQGTHFYEEATGSKWNIFDQLIVSRPLLNKNAPNTKNKAHIFRADFLLTEEEGEKKPLRSFIGYRYNRGYSDHLPVYLDIYLDKATSQ